MRLVPSKRIFVIATFVASTIGSPFVAAAYGALAIGGSPVEPGEVFALVLRKRTPEEATSAALRECRHSVYGSISRSIPCRIAATFEGKCLALARDESDEVAWAIADTAEAAAERAMAKCQGDSPGANARGCKVEAVGCDTQQLPAPREPSQR
jgi:hypothetical protein